MQVDPKEGTGQAGRESKRAREREATEARERGERKTTGYEPFDDAGRTWVVAKSMQVDATGRSVPVGICVSSSSVYVSAEMSNVCARVTIRQRFRFREGLVFQAHRLLYHSTLGLRVIKKKIQE